MPGQPALRTTPARPTSRVLSEFPRDPPTDAALHVHVTREGEIVVGDADPERDHASDLPGLAAELDGARLAGRGVVYSRDDPERDPPPTALDVLGLIMGRGLPVRLVSLPDRPPLDPAAG